MYDSEKVEICIIKKFFNNKGRDCIIVEIDGVDYEECVRAAPNFWANKKPGAYGAGLGATVDDDYKPVRTGLLGQMAFGKVTGLPVDTEIRSGGDNYDFLIFDCKVDIKCPMKCGDILIYHTNEWGKRIPLNKDIYVCCYMENEDRKNKNATVIIAGYALKKDVLLCKVEKGRKGKGHLNYVLPIYNSHPIIKLIEAINKRNHI